MEEQIRIGIVGYGNLGKGVELAIKQNEDMQLVAIFSRREPENLGIVDKTIPVLPISKAKEYQDRIDVMILCGGSARDLPEQGPFFAKFFNTVDSFDTHAKIPQYYEAVNQAATAHGKVSIISVGWDPGLFSLLRTISEAILPDGKTYTFWGKGVSQGHSDAIRRIEGVKTGIQYTIPSDEAITRVRDGERPDLAIADKHQRECFVVAKDGADIAKIESTIKTMPDYFLDYKTTVHFISETEFKEKHSQMPHGGFAIRSGQTNGNNNQLVEFALKLSSNPEFTASVLTAYARAAYRLKQEGQIGAKTVIDIAPIYLAKKPVAILRSEL